MVIFTKEHCMQRKYFIIKLDYSMMKVYNGYTNKEVNRNHKKFQKAAILFWDEGKSTQAADESLGK
jgi:hypothetical protein